jgi:hypothetical protein
VKKPHSERSEDSCESKASDVNVISLVVGDLATDRAVARAFSYQVLL